MLARLLVAAYVDCFDIGIGYMGIILDIQGVLESSDEWNWFIFMMAISLFGLPEMYYLYFRKVDVSL
jgi:hypothetical protein